MRAYYPCMQDDSPILRRLRELDRTQGWLARKLGVSPSTVNRWIKGTKPLLPHRRREISLILGVSVADIGTDTPEDVAA